MNQPKNNVLKRLQVIKIIKCPRGYDLGHAFHTTSLRNMRHTYNRDFMSYRIEEWGHKSFRGGTKLYTPRYGTTVKQGKSEYIRKASWKYSIASQRTKKQ